jgi:hypothetical protein
MTRKNSWLSGPLAALALMLLGGCAGPQSMSPSQKEAYDLRRYCEQHPEEIEKCLGFLGFH